MGTRQGPISVYSAVPLKCGQFSPKSSQQTPYSLPVRVRYAVYFVSSVSDLCSDIFIAVLCVIWYIRPRYNNALDCINHFPGERIPNMEMRY